MIWTILAVAAILRLIKIDQSLWLDEAINVLASQNYSFWGMITKYPIGDFHPPGYFALLWVWTRIGGVGEIWVRFPSVIFGVATIWLVYLLGKELFNKKIGILAAFLLAIAPLHIYYSQEARMYSLATFSATLSFYYFWKLINNDNRGNAVGYGISNILVLYSDYLVYLVIPAQIIFLLLFQRNSIKKILFPLGLAITTLLPWLMVFPRQLSSGVGAASVLPGWADVVGGASIKELLLIPVKTFFGRLSIEVTLIYTVVAGGVGLLYGILIFHALKELDKAIKLLVLWIIIPVVLAFLISFFIPVLSYFRMLFILPAVYLLVAKGIDRASRSSTLRGSDLEGGTPWRHEMEMVAIISLISLISLGIYYTNPKFQREDWMGAVNKIDELAQKNGVIVFENNDLPAPLIYYSQNLSPAMGGLTKIPAESQSDLSNIPGKENIYLFEYLVDITDPKRLLEKNIQNKGYKEVGILNFNGVGFVRHYQLK